MRDEEAMAKRRWEHVTGRELIEWDCSGRQGAVDFRCTNAPTVSVEVKLLTVEEVHRSNAIRSRRGAIDSSLLSMRWHVVVDETSPGPHPRELEDWLVDLEAEGVTTTRPNVTMNTITAQLRAIMTWNARTGGLLAQGYPVSQSVPPGIDVAAAGGAVGYTPATAAVTIESWLHGSTTAAQSLRKKLAASDDNEGHAFLIATAATDFTMGFRRWTTDELPEAALTLPVGIDAVWISTSAEFASITLPTSSTVAERALALGALIEATDLTKPLTENVLVWRYDAQGWRAWRTPW